MFNVISFSKLIAVIAYELNIGLNIFIIIILITVVYNNKEILSY